MKIFITGGAGYIGSVLVPSLLAAGHKVTVLDSFIHGQSGLLECCAHEGFDVVRGDCRDERLLREHATAADILIPLAALVGAPLCDRDPWTARSVNQQAVETLCRMAGKGQRMIYPTTNSGYGIGEKGKFCTEETPLRPISLYGETKARAEDAVLSRGDSLTFRLATVFGMSPRMRFDLLVNDFVRRAVHDRAVVVFEGHFQRNYIHVRDVARAFNHAIDNFDAMKGCCYNVGLNDANLTKLELCVEIKKQVPSFVFIESAIGEDPDKRDYIVSNDRILAAGFRAEYTLERGIAELIKGCRILRNSVHGNV